MGRNSSFSLFGIGLSTNQLRISSFGRVSKIGHATIVGLSPATVAVGIYIATTWVSQPHDSVSRMVVQLVQGSFFGGFIHHLFEILSPLCWVMSS